MRLGSDFVGCQCGEQGVSAARRRREGGRPGSEARMARLLHKAGVAAACWLAEPQRTRALALPPVVHLCAAFVVALFA